MKKSKATKFFILTPGFVGLAKQDLVPQYLSNKSKLFQRRQWLIMNFKKIVVLSSIMTKTANIKSRKLNSSEKLVLLSSIAAGS